jgi:segregation and condensation protein B
MAKPMKKRAKSAQKPILQKVLPKPRAREGPSPKLQVEALLYAAGKTLSEEAIITLSKLEPRTVKRALHELQEEYASRDSALSIYNDPTGWKMMVRELYVPTVKNIVADTELSRACMETLAIIAYKYPKVLQSEVIDIRGSGAYEHMAELERLGFILRTREHRSYAVKLTDKFFSYFDVAGGKNIREVFKNIKPPVKLPEQKTLGELPVVDVPRSARDPKHHKTLEGMEVVGVSETPEGAPEGMAPPSEGSEEETPPEIPPAEPPEAVQTRNEFLDDLDRRIATISQRNTEHDNDETLKRRPLPGAEQPTEGSAEENAEGDAVPGDAPSEENSDENVEKKE